MGRIVRPHGLRGGVVVELWSNVTGRLEPGSCLRLAGRQLTVRSSGPTGGAGGHPRWIVNFAGVEDREAAETLRGGVLHADPVEVPGALWVHELVGAELRGTDGSTVGRVAAVEANPASDLLVLSDGRLVPLTFVTRSDSGDLTVDAPPGLLEQ